MSVALHVLCLLSSVLLIVLVLSHRGSGGGLSDLLGGSGSDAASSATASTNLTRFTLAVGGLWLGSIVALGILGR